MAAQNDDSNATPIDEYDRSLDFRLDSLYTIAWANNDETAMRVFGTEKTRRFIDDFLSV